MAAPANSKDLDTRFHAVYLLTSCDPRQRHRFYIGYTNNPLRRLRQHNGEIQGGAWKTAKKGRPWRIVLFVSGFTEDRAGLRFEWMWQQPDRAKATREAVSKLRLSRLPFAVAVLHLLLYSDEFRNQALTVNILNQADYASVKGAALLSGIPDLVPSALLQVREVTETEVEQMVRYCDAAEDDAQRDVTDISIGSLLLQNSSSASNVGGDAAAGNASSSWTMNASQRPEGLMSPDRSTTEAEDDDDDDAASPGRRAQRRKQQAPVMVPRPLLEAENLIPCTLCCMSAPTRTSFRCHATGDCPMQCHADCLAAWVYAHAPAVVADGAAEDPLQPQMSQTVLPDPPMPALIPTHPAPCPVCGEALFWPVLIQQLRVRRNQHTAQVIQGRKAMMEQRRALLRALESSGTKQPRGNKAKLAKAAAAPARNDSASMPPPPAAAPSALGESSQTWSQGSAGKRMPRRTRVRTRGVSAVESSQDVADSAGSGPIPPPSPIGGMSAILGRSTATDPILGGGGAAGAAAGSSSAALLDEEDQWLLDM